MGKMAPPWPKEENTARIALQLHADEEAQAQIQATSASWSKW